MGVNTKFTILHHITQSAITYTCIAHTPYHIEYTSTDFRIYNTDIGHTSQDIELQVK